MPLPLRIQNDFNKIFIIDEVQYPYSLQDILIVHTQQKTSNKLYSYLHEALHYSLSSKSIFFSLYDTSSESKIFEYTIADIIIVDNDNKDIKNTTEEYTDFEPSYKTKKISVLIRKKSPYDIFKKNIKNNDNKYSSYSSIIFKIFYNETLVVVSYNTSTNHIDILYSKDIYGASISDVKQFNKNVLVACGKLFGKKISYKVIYLDSPNVCNQGEYNKLIWLIISLKYFSPELNISDIKKYIMLLSTSQRHNLILNWANFMIKYSKNLTNIEFDTLAMTERINTKQTKKLQAQAKVQAGGEVNMTTTNHKQFVTSYIKQFFTIQ